MSGIRVTYSGLVSLAAGTLTLISGLVFTLIISRGLSVTEYGTWGVIWGLLAYVLLVDPAVSYWATREAAQGTKSAKTALVTSGGLSIIATVAYIIIAYLYAPSGDAGLFTLLFAAILVPTEIIKRLLAALALSYSPQAIEYALFIGELTKTILAFALIFSFDMGIAGALLAALFGAIANIVLLIIYLGKNLGGNFDVSFIKKWMRLFWIPTWIQLVSILTRSDVIIFSVATGSVIGVAYWTAARTIALVATHSARLNTALYPKLLGGGAREELEENLGLVLYVTFALAAIIVALAAPALWALNPEYEKAYPAIIILVGLVIMRMLTNIFSRALVGIEDVDTVSTSMRLHLKSKLFTIPALMVIQRSAYLVLLAVMLIALVPLVQNVSKLVIYWATLALVIQIPHFLYICIITRREFHPHINITRILKYVACALVVFGITYIVSESTLVREGGALEFVPKVALVAIMGIVIYITLTYALDSKIRRLVTGIIEELWGKKT